MDPTIAGILTLDGLTNGAIYALLALATVLVFAVTRVIFIPQGEFVAFGALTLALFSGEWSAFVFMSLLGMSYGSSGTIFGSVWPEIYGTAHLGAIRAITMAVSVLGTAIGPGLTGILIDLGIDLPLQVGVMSAYAFMASLLMLFVSRRLTARLAASASRR